MMATLTEQTVTLYRVVYTKAITAQHVSADTIAIHDALVRLGGLPADPTIRQPLRDGAIELPWMMELVPR